jgi:hypothetical protein
VIAGPAVPGKRAGDLGRVMDGQQAMNDRSTMIAPVANGGGLAVMPAMLIALGCGTLSRLRGGRGVTGGRMR